MSLIWIVILCLATYYFAEKQNQKGLSQLNKTIDKLTSEKTELEKNNDKNLTNLTKSKKENNDLKIKNAKLEKKANTRLNLKQMHELELEQLMKKRATEIRKLDNKIIDKKSKVKELDDKRQKLEKKLIILNNQIIDISEELNYENYGLYKPRYKFANSGEYKDKLSKTRDEQKDMIKNNTAGTIFYPMLLDNSYKKGKALQQKNIKQLIRTFNGECEAAINKVTKSNIDRIEKRIYSSYDQLNRLNKSNGVCLNHEYLDSKLDEAHVALEYELKKEEEKEALREQREREREEKKLQREIISERKKFEKDETHFVQAKTRVEEKISNSSDTKEVVNLKRQLQELQNKLDTIRKRKEKLEDRTKNPTAGYVYIISNIGSFGNDIYKIGVTRRLEPKERINELGNASVPFKFDVNAMVFSDDAYKLESELHNRFNNNRVNMVNKRKEYFKIPMDQLKEVLSEYKELTFNFNEYPDAYEYRDTQYIKKHEKLPTK